MKNSANYRTQTCFSGLSSQGGLKNSYSLHTAWEADLQNQLLSFTIVIHKIAVYWEFCNNNCLYFHACHSLVLFENFQINFCPRTPAVSILLTQSHKISFSFNRYNLKISKRCWLIVHQLEKIINILCDPAIFGKNNNRLRSMCFVILRLP